MAHKHSWKINRVAYDHHNGSYECMGDPDRPKSLGCGKVLGAGIKPHGAAGNGKAFKKEGGAK